jgi:hypothetical protein
MARASSVKAAVSRCRRSDAQVVKARRRITKMVKDGLAVQVSGPVSGGAHDGEKGGATGATYAATTRRTEPESADVSADAADAPLGRRDTPPKRGGCRRLTPTAERN